MGEGVFTKVLYRELDEHICTASEGSVRVGCDAVFLNYWCSFAEIFILSYSIIAVLQNQAVCDI